LPDIQSSLSQARGNKALQDGDEAGAVKFLKQAAEHHAQLPENSTSMNNGALIQFDLFRLTRDAQTRDRGLEMIERAIALEPRNSLILHNAADVVLEVAMIDLIAGGIDHKIVKHH